MGFLGKAFLLVMAGVLLAGCTLHFKATDLEVDAERQRVQHNRTYELTEVSLLNDSG